MKLGRNDGSGNSEPADAVLLITTANTTRNWPTPSVATMLMRRGALRSRRTTPVSAAAPVSPATSKAIGNATQYGKCHFTAAIPKKAAANAPIWPWAKLMMRLVR